MAEESRILHMCSTCFRVSEVHEDCHGKPMNQVDCGQPGEATSWPCTDEAAHLTTRAPRWWIEQVTHRRFEERGRP